MMYNNTEGSTGTCTNYLKLFLVLVVGSWDKLLYMNVITITMHK